MLSDLLWGSIGVKCVMSTVVLLLCTARVGVWSIAISLSVCVCVRVSVREHISGTAGPIFTKFFVHVPRGRSSDLLWWRCDGYVLLWMMSRLVVMGHKSYFNAVAEVDGHGCVVKRDIHHCMCCCVGGVFRPYVRSKGRKFERARGRRASRGFKN